MFLIFKKISWFMKKNAKLFILAAIGDVLAGTISVVTPQIIGQTIDLMARNQLTWEAFISSVGLLIGIMIIGYIAAVVWIYVLFELGLRFEKQFRSNFYNHVIKMDGGFFKKHAVGDLMVRVTTDLKQVAIVTSDGFFFLLEGTVFLALIVIAMVVTVDVKLTAIAVVPLLAVTFLLSKFGDKISEFHKAAQERLSELSESLLESVRGVQAIRAYRKQETNYQMLKEKVELVRDTYAKGDKYENAITFLLYLAFGAVEVTVLFIGANMVFRSELTPGALVTFMLYIGMLGWPLFSIGNVFGILRRGDTSYDRINDILEIETAVAVDQEKETVSVLNELTFNNYAFKYPDAIEGEYALADVNFSLKKGQTLGIVGVVGGGRTTLVRQLLGEYSLDNDEMISLNGKSYNDYNVASVRKLFGYVPQEHILFSKSVKDNLKVAKIDATDEEIDEAIDLADFRKDMQFLSDGLDTMTGESGVMLSGGQKQRLAIARAFLSNPEILVLDDALSAVDGTTEARIIGNIIQHREGRTNIIIAHRLSAVVHADNIIVLQDGKILESGTHIELLQQNGWYKEQFEYQSMEVE